MSDDKPDTSTEAVEKFLAEWRKVLGSDYWWVDFKVPVLIETILAERDELRQAATQALAQLAFCRRDIDMDAPPFPAEARLRKVLSDDH